MEGDKEEIEPPSKSKICFYEEFHLKMIKPGDLLSFWDQTTDATNHFLHVRCHGVDPAAQPVVLGHNPVVLQSEPCEGNKKRKHICAAVQG